MAPDDEMMYLGGQYYECYERLLYAVNMNKGGALVVSEEAGLGKTTLLLKLISELRNDGMTIVLSSHLLGLVQSICDRVALFRNGRIGLTGRVEDLVRQVLGSAFTIDVDADAPHILKELKGIDGVASVTPAGPGRLRIEAERDVRPAIARRVHEKGGSLREMALRRASLDDVYANFFSAREMDHAA